MRRRALVPTAPGARVQEIYRAGPQAGSAFAEAASYSTRPERFGKNAAADLRV